MARFLCVSATFLDPVFHGRGDGGLPEWPPSPLRAFQALVAAGLGRGEVDRVAPALRWLERMGPPTIVAPEGHRGSSYSLSVPNNSMDLVARFWTRGNESAKDAQPSTHRTMKAVRPTRLLGGDSVSYLWTLPGDPAADVLGHVETISALARSLIALGWGVDLVAGLGRVLTEAEAEALPGMRWCPIDSPGGVALRTPTEGTLRALEALHETFLNRAAEGGFALVSPLPPHAYREVLYRRDDAMQDRHFAAFQLIRPRSIAERRSFAATQTACVAGMLRHACAEALRGRLHDEAWINEYVLGHRQGPGGAESPARFSYLPLPSITPRGVGTIQRVLIAEPFGGTGVEAGRLGDFLLGQALIREPRPGEGPESERERVVARLDRFESDDWRLGPYLGPSRDWASVTPIVLPFLRPGRVEANGRRRTATVPGAVTPVRDGQTSWRKASEVQAAIGRAEKQLRKAIRHAGLASNPIEELEVRPVSFWPGVEPSHHYRLPDHLTNSVVCHARIRWRDAIRGPLAIGGGRFCGLGLFAALDPE